MEVLQIQSQHDNNTESKDGDQHAETVTESGEEQFYEESPSFIYRDYTVVRDNKLKYTMCIISCQLTLIMLMTILNLYVYSLDVRTKYSQNEKKWICETLSEVAILYTGIVIFQIFTLGISPTANEYRLKQVVMIVFTLILYVRIVILYYEGLEINREAHDALEKAQKGGHKKDNEEVDLKIR